MTQEGEESPLAQDDETGDAEYLFAALLAAVSPDDRQTVLDIVRILAIQK